MSEINEINNNNNNNSEEIETKRRKIEEDEEELSLLQQYSTIIPDNTSTSTSTNNNSNNNNNTSTSLQKNSHNNNISDVRGRAQRYLQLMNSEQIMQALLDIAESIPEALEKLEEKAQSDPAHRKLFIRGLAWDTTDEQLHAAFNIYGEIEDAAVVMDRTTGKNKGYGFVIFKDMDSAYAALQEPEKEIDGRKTHCNLASLGGQGQQTRTRSGSFGNSVAAAAASVPYPPQPEEEIYGTRSIEYRKLFIRGLDYNTTVDELKTIFSEYGEIEECVIPTERSTGKSKGFAFLTFKQASSATDALHHPVREIGGRTVNIHLATQTNPHRPSGGGGGNGGGGGGGPMGMGYMGVPQMPGPGFMGPPQGGMPPSGYMGPDPGYYPGPRGMVPPGRYTYPPGQGVW